MALIEVTLHEVELTVAPKAVIFGSANETIEAAPDSTTDQCAECECRCPGTEPTLLATALIGVGIGIAVWLGRRKQSALQRES